MDPQTASLEMMEKFWTDWFTAVGNMQSEAAKSMGAATEAAEAAEAGDAGPRSHGPTGMPGMAGMAGMPGGMPGMPGMPGMAAFPFATPEAMRQFQNAFLQSLSQYCEEYMRTPEFLGAMKRSMDNALAFRQQVNEFLNSAVSTGFQPPGGMPADQAVIVDAVRETERKLRDHIDVLSDRLEQLEARLDGQTKEGTT